MGFLNIKGKMLTYEQYKDLIQKYKDRGILEFIELFNAHKDKKKAPRDLHWGEELEYMLFHLYDDRSEAKLTNKAFDLIQEFNENKVELAKEDPEIEEIELHPEFGNWMVEAVPTHPYGTYEDLAEMLSCFEKIRKR